MGLEHLAAVWELSRQSGSNLVVLLAVASYSDHNGEWIIDQGTLERRTRLGNRRVRQILTELVSEGELAVVSHHGRGKLSTYRLLVGEENWKQSTPFPARKLEAGNPLSAEKPAAESRFSSRKPEAEARFPGEKPAADSLFSAEKPEAGSQFPAPPCPPFPPDPQIPPIPPEKQETCGLRPLSGPQKAVFRVNLLLEQAGIRLPTPAQIGLWSKTLGGAEPLIELLERLILAGLATKRQPIDYVHRVVMERVAQPARPEPGKILDARAGRELLRAAGSDEIRWQQALEIIANTEES